MGKRTWFKIYADGWLTGSMRKETLPTRAIFVDLMALAASGEYGDDGVIMLKNFTPIPVNTLCQMLSVTKYLLENALKDLVTSQKISVDEGGIITILNWKKYQSEYDRQSQYRGKHNKKDVTKSYNNTVTKSYKPVVTKSTPEIENEKEIYKENYIKENTETVFSVIADLAVKTYGRQLSSKEAVLLSENANEYGAAIWDKAVTLSSRQSDTNKRNLNYALGIAKSLKATVIKDEPPADDDDLYPLLN